jgi:hypothetical protein
LEGFRKCGELYWMQLLPIATTSSICGDSIGSTYWKDSVNAENYWQFCREMRDPGAWLHNQESESLALRLNGLRVFYGT